MHLTADAVQRVAGQVVITGFVADGSVKNLRQFQIRGSCPQGPFQVFLMIGQQTGSQLTTGRQAKTIARITEVPAQGMDEPDFTCSALVFVSICRPVIFAPAQRD